MSCLSTSLPSFSVPLQTPLLTLTPPSPPPPPPPLPLSLLLPPASSPGDTQQSAQRNSRNRDPRCWACTSGRKKCTVEINASGQAPCQRCQSLGRDCSDEAPKEWTRRTLSWLKCPQCRTRKLKCEFLEGPWPIKCRQCNLHGLQCSEPRETERRAAKGKLNSTDGSLSDSISSTGSHTSRTPHAEQIPSPGISSQTINDAALLLQLQEPPPATYMPLWPLDYDFDRNTFQSQPAGFPSLSTLSVSMSSPPNYVYPPVKELTKISQPDSGYSFSDQLSDSGAHYSMSSNLYESQYQFDPTNPKYAFHSGSLSSSSRGPTDKRQIGDRCVYCNGYYKLLRRHIMTKHPETLRSSAQLYFCTESTCDRAAVGFSRKDNLTQHLRLVHGKDIPKRSRRIHITR